MNLHAQPWIADFASPLCSIIFRLSGFWGSFFYQRFAFEISAFWGRGGVFLLGCTRSVPGLVGLIGPLYCSTGRVFLSFWVWFGVVLRITSCLHPPLIAGLWSG